jgi:polysaccharide export outer membrane protein
MRFATYLTVLAVACGTGCSDIPTAGPRRSEIVKQAQAEGQTKFALVEVDDHVIDALSNEPRSLDRSQAFDRGKPATDAIGIGDSVAVALWQSVSGNIFGDAASGATSPMMPSGTAVTGSQSITIPEQVVGTRGTITIPFIGPVNVANRTAGAIQKEIEARLQQRAFHPQAIVTVTKNVSGTVTVSGEGMAAARIPLSPRGDRLLDVIAADGGAKSEPYETVVRLTRDAQTRTILLSRLISDPGENIYVWPGDVITLIKEPRTFTVFGATQSNTQIAFGADQIDLAQAIAKAGGLQDARADPAGVFLFRFEPLPVASALGVPPAPNGSTPVVYHLNLANVSNYFLARRFTMRDNDIIYSANAPLSDLQKFFTLIGSVTSPTIGGLVATQSVAGRH